MRYFNFLIVAVVAVLAFLKFEELQVLELHAQLIKQQHIEQRVREHRDEFQMLTRYIESEMRFQNVKNSVALQHAKKHINSYYKTADEYWLELARDDLQKAMEELDKYRKGVKGDTRS